ncbi:MAG: SRPBCC domain-containing protein [Cumulibacter sp.]
MAGPDDKFTVTRTINAPRETVWSAWTNARSLHIWMHPRGVFTPPESIKSDFRTGGAYAYTLVVPTRGTFPTAGTFLDIQEPRRLQFTWGNPEDSEKNFPVVTVELEASGDATELTFTLDGVRDDRGQERSLYELWNDALDELERFVQQSS